jgi:hypothetical protein
MFATRPNACSGGSLLPVSSSAFVALAPAGRHPKSSMPLAREQRIFFLDGEPIASMRYWDEAEYTTTAAPMDELRALASGVRSRF